MDELIISVSGLRGIIGTSLTPEVAARYVAAFAKQLASASSDQRRPRIIVGRDGRGSGVMLQRVVVASLEASGCDVLVADVAATPTIGVLVQQSSANGAIQITASHNPSPYNGIKLFSDRGRVIGAEAGAKVRLAYEQGQACWQSYDRIGTVTAVADPHQPHLRAVLETVDADSIAKRRYRVLLDSNHGSGAALGQRLLEALGCEVVLVGATPDGQFEHVPEPTAENLQTIAARVATEKCDVGFCQDPDADRLALIDAAGRYIGEEYTLALCVQRALSFKSTCGPIVINGATSSMSERLAVAAGVPAYRSAVGEANVADLMIATQATYGGEGNGGPIDPRVGYVRDSFVAMAQVLALMAEKQATLAELADALPKLAIYKTKATVQASALPGFLQRVAQNFSDAKADFSDGLRLAWSDRWLLVRGSNTEPIVRLIAEAASEQEAKALCDQAAQCLAK
ncbi:MAG: phosphoglucosamine mutase [Planctomycetaceae bacterium]